MANLIEYIFVSQQTKIIKKCKDPLYLQYTEKRNNNKKDKLTLEQQNWDMLP